MDKLEIRRITISKDYEEDCFFINGKALYEYASDGRISDDLVITWDAPFDHDGDARFMRELLKADKLNLPILSCPDDLDFSCIVITAEIEKTDRYVLWKRIGKVDHSHEDRNEEKEHGIVYVDSYTDDDWTKYRDTALLAVDSREWREWISSNWSEELFRRRMNYTYPYYQKDGNIEWIFDCGWCFDRNEYDSVVSSCHPRWCMDKKAL